MEIENAGTLKTDEEVFATADKYLANHYARLPVNFISGKGVWLYDSANRAVLDMMAQYSAAGFGRGYLQDDSHPFFNQVVDAILQEYRYGCGMLPGSCPNNVVANCVKSLCEFTGMDRAVFMCSGAEVFDTAVKIARKWAHTVKRIPENQAEIIVCRKPFHGRTLGAISAATEDQYRRGFGPLLSGFRWADFGDVSSLEMVLYGISKNVAAFIVEPVQAEGGINVPPDGYLIAAKEICRRYGALFVLDEVQTGFGRTGAKFAWEHEGLDAKPDLMMLGKMMCGGSFIGSAVVGRDDVMSVLRPGDHGSTFGGIPLACAAAAKVIEIFNSHPELISHVKRLGEYFIEKLKEIVRDINSSFIKEVRGRGLLVGVEFTEKLAPIFRDELFKEGIFAGVAGHDYVLRFSPALIIEYHHIDSALPKIKKVLEEAK